MPPPLHLMRLFSRPLASLHAPHGTAWRHACTLASPPPAPGITTTMTSTSHAPSAPTDRVAAAADRVSATAAADRVSATAAADRVSATAATDRVSREASPPTGADAVGGATDISRGFALAPSVAFWSSFDSRAPGALRALVNALATDVVSQPSAMPYYAYCFGRSLFFSGLGLAGLQSRNVAQALRGVGLKKLNVNPGAHLAEAGFAFRDDWARIIGGVYGRPWDVDLRHRQARPGRAALEAFVFLRHARATLAKRFAEEEVGTDVWLDSVAFPEYYKRTYHFQTDGWVSSKSADAYEVSTETLFLGRQDAMQRLALVGIREDGSVGTGDGMTIVEVGAGTGRLATFVLDNYPRAAYVVTDLSPFYLQKARENVEYWRKFRGIKDDQEGSRVKYIQASAEALPLEDASVDVVVSVYLFHELPPKARKDVAREAARVLKPGGTFVWVDSIQLGDRASRDQFLDKFEEFNEPWYRSFVREDFGKLFTDVGLVPRRKELSSVTKMLTFRKELQTGQ